MRAHAAVPRHVHEADELVPVAGTDPAEALPLDLAPPVIVDHAMAEALGMQGVDLGVLEVSPPVIRDVHRAMVGPSLGRVSDGHPAITARDIRRLDARISGRNLVRPRYRRAVRRSGFLLRAVCPVEGPQGPWERKTPPSASWLIKPSPIGSRAGEPRIN